MPKNHKILRTDEEICAWFSTVRFAGDVKASKRHLRSWRRAWSQNGNRFRAGDEVLVEHKSNILKRIRKAGATIAQIQEEFRISINHIKRILAELVSEGRIGRVRQGKAYLYQSKES
jgi:predicted HTH transcriptional regulator